MDTMTTDAWRRRGSGIIFDRGGRRPRLPRLAPVANVGYSGP